MLAYRPVLLIRRFAAGSLAIRCRKFSDALGTLLVILCSLAFCLLSYLEIHRAPALLMQFVSENKQSSSIVKGSESHR
jgi:hypothetical protein